MQPFSPAPVFISSAHYGLEDLRGELFDHLKSLGTSPFLSSEAGFPDYPGMPPYVQCLRVIERCLLVVGVIDRRYGQTFNDWFPYKNEDFSGHSPTHAELKHAINQNKRVLVYVRDDILPFYELYRKNKEAFSSLVLPYGLQVETLGLFEELKTAKLAPWIEPFRDVRDIKLSIARRLHDDLHKALLQREMLAMSGFEFLIENILRLEPDLKEKVRRVVMDHPAEDQPELLAYFKDLLDSKQHTRQRLPGGISGEVPLLELGGGEAVLLEPRASSFETFKDFLVAIFRVMREMQAASAASTLEELEGDEVQQLEESGNTAAREDG